MGCEYYIRPVGTAGYMILRSLFQRGVLALTLARRKIYSRYAYHFRIYVKLVSLLRKVSVSATVRRFAPNK